MRSQLPSVNPEDLSARSRRGAASPEEERELVRAIDASAALRVAHRVGLDMDEGTQVRAGDEELILAAADAALRVTGAGGADAVRAGRRAARADHHARASARKHPRRIASALVAAAMISASGMAAAWWTGVAKPLWLWTPTVLEPATDSPAPARKPRAQSLHAPEPSEPSTAPVAEPEPASRTAPVVASAPSPEESTAPLRRRAGRAAAEPTAAELFRGANAARRAGDFGAARRAYSHLIAMYPFTDEARLSQVSLGKLLLANGDAVDAEREFRRYLTNGHEPLAEEALVSQAESLRALNRAGDERAAWTRLLAEHPNSVYAARARARLRALGQDEAAAGH